MLGPAPTREQEDALWDYGLNIGMAFQLVDDLLDFTGEEDALGKPVGGDLREGKMTLPVIHLLASGERARRDADSQDRQGAERVASTSGASCGTCSRSIASIEYARRVATDFVERAKKALEMLSRQRRARRADVPARLRACRGIGESRESRGSVRTASQRTPSAHSATTKSATTSSTIPRSPTPSSTRSCRSSSGSKRRTPISSRSDSPTQRVSGRAGRRLRHGRTCGADAQPRQRVLGRGTARIRRARAPRPCRGRQAVEQVDYVAELKIDGLSLALTYEDGTLVRGATRGDGVRGEEVTSNVRTIRAIPLKLTAAQAVRGPPTIEIRGEVYLPRKVFERINKEQADAGEPLFANPRNAAAGTMRNLDPALVAKRGLSA